MYRFLSVAAGAATIASASPYKNPPSNNYNGGKASSNYKATTFAPAYQIIDPSYATTILTRYQECLAKKCTTLPSAYAATTVEDNLGTIAAYTSCVTSCAGAEALQTTQDFQALLGEVLSIGASQLKTVRKHLSGQDATFDAIAERIHIGESCCLPTDHFAEWSRILVPVTVAGIDTYIPPVTTPKPDDTYGGYGEYDNGYGGDDSYSSDNYDSQGGDYEDGADDYDESYPKQYGSNYQLLSAEERVLIEQVSSDPVDDGTRADYLISAPEYLAACTGSPRPVSGNKLLDTITCDDAVTQYLHFLQSNVGHLILAADCDETAPDGACCNSAHSNPRASAFHNDVCVAYETTKGGKVSTVSVPFVKPVERSATTGRLVCPSDKLPKAVESDPDFIINYQRVSYRDLKYFTVTSGLPSKVTVTDHLTTCEYDRGLVGSTIRKDGYFKVTDTPLGPGDIEAAKKCPSDGLFEYCSLDQYAGFLQTQLFDHSRCDIADLRLQNTDYASSYQTVACLYKIFTLKCDCMEAVLNCYTHASKFDNALSKTIGQAASILCGFILCQQPSVYSLFGEEFAIDHAILIKEFLQSAGLLTASQVTPALTMLVSFGLGMIALVAAKKVTSPSPVKIENGYQNLI
ncbi:hypothetical protein DYB37_002935 [Aphanomyces astaci]|uniref:Uncharacterized protein n=1 Tax=Aphanomyces astaci TaxID=112090 RepID=A0A397CJR3_APHAT|nr:hypothetical protein DYB36_006142 [Aphanomyces astaci]RHY25700.1 hypothetical protein DYB25_005030 [Aphanomyces astaci]RHY45123.1 hypothetical protein DYB38_011184 [Aphanomyces astaci]RHY84125.1 hypothetical protein DYB35_001029 [Aphanomyces astaci]RHZ20903.1 hypothetical protein DYB37_002935 [Aphanomyces astaci]